MSKTIPAIGVPRREAIPRATTKIPKEFVRRSTPRRSERRMEVRQM
jgi:hypothetical protein